MKTYEKDLHTRDELLCLDNKLVNKASSGTRGLLLYVARVPPRPVWPNSRPNKSGGRIFTEKYTLMVSLACSV